MRVMARTDAQLIPPLAPPFFEKGIARFPHPRNELGEDFTSPR
jgi:hypothetical protein